MKFLSIIKIYKYLSNKFSYRHRHNRKIYMIFREIFKQKVPQGDNYSFKVYHSREVLSLIKRTGYEKLYLVGDNWANNKDKPIALIFCCNDWKLGFLSDYLKEYRCAFVSRKLNGFRAVLTILKLRIKPEKYFVWGYNDSGFMRSFFKIKKAIRIEDGFVRSAKLGAEHATPYSLAFDERGFYYNCYKESDLEMLLNNYKLDQSMLNHAEIALDTVKKLGISKYNPISLVANNQVKIKKRIAIIGQVYSDASLRYGNPKKYTFEELVLEAREKNPHVEIIYRPHPEVYKGYQKSQKKRKYFDKLAKISSPEENIIDFLDSVDHVYVISSLVGLEALIRGKEVTVFGAPFYAGWGLTDDRVKIKRRSRTLSIIELFAIVYLKYPRYLADTKDSFVGLMSAIFRIDAEKSIDTFDYYNKLGNTDIDNKVLIESKYFVSKIFSEDNSDLLSNFNKINFLIYLNGGAPVFFEKVYVLAIFGVLKNELYEDQFLERVRGSLSFEAFHEVLLSIYHIDRKYMSRHILWLKSNIGDNLELDQRLLILCDEDIKPIYTDSKKNIEFEDVIANLNFSKEEIQSTAKQLLVNREYKEFARFTKIYSDFKFVDSGLSEFQNEVSRLAFDQYKFLISEKLFDEALILAELMLIYGWNTLSLLSSLTSYAKLRFDFISARRLAILNQNINLYAENRNMSLFELGSYLNENINYNRGMSFLSKLFRQVLLKPDKIAAVHGFVEKITFLDESFTRKIIDASLNLDNEISIRKAQAYMAVENPQKAVSIQRKVIYSIADVSPHVIAAYTQALSYSGKIIEAIDIIEKALKKYPIRFIMHEAIRLYVLNTDYNKCMEIYNLACERYIELGDMHIRKTFFGNRMPGKALQAFKDIHIKNTVAKYLKEKYVSDPEEIHNLDSILLLPIFGPGDELRFSSIYNSLLNIYPETSFSIACSPKLYSLFKRSFPKIDFISVNRLRNTDPFDINDYNKVYGSDLTLVMDNNAVASVEHIGKAIMVTDLLSEALKGYDSFAGTPYLKANYNRKKDYQELLPKNKKLIGLSWRSSLTTHSRNEHYLTIQEISSLFEIENIQFVNLQYDECFEELAWVEKRYPGKIINIKELDQYNDLEGVASLLKCLDLVISPATTVVELAGALGCNTWMFSNSSEIDWRKIDDEGTDTWHNSIKIVDLEKKGDKVKLVEKLCEKLKEYVRDDCLGVDYVS